MMEYKSNFPNRYSDIIFVQRRGDWDRQNRVNSWYTQYVRVIRHIWIAITRGRPTAEVKPCYFKTSNPPRIRVVNISRSDRSNHETSPRKSRVRRPPSRNWRTLKLVETNRWITNRIVKSIGKELRFWECFRISPVVTLLPSNA